MAEQTSKKTLVPTRATLERQRFGETVAGLYQQHAEALGRGLSRELGADAPNGEQLGRALGKRLASLGSELVEADLANQREREQDGPLKEERGKAEEDLRNALNELQEMSTGMFGAGVLATFKLDGAVPADVSGLLAHAREVSAAVSGADADTLPKQRIKGATVDLKEWAAPLEEHGGKLAGVIEKITAEARANAGAAQRKAQAGEAFDKGFRRSVALLEALLHYAGETEAAEKVKPAIRGEGG